MIKIIPLIIIILISVSFVAAQKNYTIDINQPIIISAEENIQKKDASAEKEYNVIVYQILIIGLWFLLLSYILSNSDGMMGRLKDNRKIKDRLIIILFIILSYIIYNYLQGMESKIITVIE